MIWLYMKPGGSDDKLLIECLPGEMKENIIVQNKTMCSWAPSPGHRGHRVGGMPGGDRELAGAEF